MPKMLHNLLCNVSRRYRVTHCDSVDDLPPRYSRKLRESCREMDGRSWSNAHDMMRDLLAEIDGEERAEKASVRKAAMFA